MSETDKERYDRLYHEVGRLTRALHNAIRDFHVGIGVQGNAEVEHELSEMADARSRLNYVITMTEQAANKTMDMVDEAAPVIQDLVGQSSALRNDWQRFAESGAAPMDQQMLGRVTHLLQTIDTRGASLNGHLTEILMAQGFQDLSGQVLRRVINLVSDVEKSLVNLVKLASNVEQVAGIETIAVPQPDSRDAAANEQQRIRAEGPQLKGPADKGQAKQDVVSNQDDVDDLLSSLGF